MEDLESKTYYELLGVERSASREQIKEAYREIARVFHPDSHFYDEIIEAASATMQATTESEAYKRITFAYNTLINDDKRKEYDRTLVNGLRDWEHTEDFWGPGKSSGPGQQAPKTQKSYAYGTFGVVKGGSDLKAAFDFTSTPKSVSEMMRPRRTWWGRLMRFFGF